jgi:tetratricopeptide (TPR) repeat protein
VSWLVLGFLVLIVNSAYLAARADPSPFYFANVMLHMALGLALAVVAAVRWARRWRGGPRLLLAAAPLLGVAAVSGVALALLGATRPHAWILWTHIATAIAGSALVLVWIAALAVRRPSWRDRRDTVVVVAVAVVAVLASAVVLAREKRAYPARYRIVNPGEPPVSMDGEGAGPKSPFFPSSAETNVGGIIPANFFMTSQVCGRCHTDIYEQWKSSAHHFSSFNNQWYRKSIEYMQDVVGTRPSKWCAGCHDHAVFFNGRFERPIKEQIHTPEAQAGLSCTSCHSIVHVKSTMGQGDFTIEYPPLHDLAASENPVLSRVHDFLLYADPEPHRRTFLKPFHREQTAAFCSSCHKVHLDVPVNAYRWFRGFNEYDNWQASAVSGEGARSFYYPPKPQKCADCHMPLVEARDPAAREGKVHSHRFPAANTAVPFVNRDAEQLRVTQEFLRDKQITVDVFGLARLPAGRGTTGAATEAPLGSAPAEGPRLASTFAQGEEAGSFGTTAFVLQPPLEVIGPLDKVEATVARGESVRVEVVVRTRKVGHFFPGGTVDAFDVWVELEATDDRGHTVFHSGRVEDGGKGPVEAGAHFYRSLLLDDHGNPINKRNAWMARSLAYVRLIPPGAADTVHYRLQVPEDCGDTIRLKAKVNYRKFSWWNTQWAFGGTRDPAHQGFSLGPDHDDGRWLFTGDTSDVAGEIKAIPDIPITVMAEAEAVLKVAPKGTALPASRPLLDREVRERWNDYGIGLLLQGDLKAAEAAFLKVTEMDPGYADGWVNVARARIQEGNMDGAEQYLRKALEIDAGLAKTHFFLAMTGKARGQYDEALAHLRTAADRYPRDRVVRNQMGRVLFLQRRYKEAVAELKKVLEVDPEDLQAQYNLMLSWQGLGDTANAERAQALYRRFKADETAQFITGPYRQLHPEDNNERQAIHEHVTATPPAPAPARGTYTAAGGGGR